MVVHKDYEKINLDSIENIKFFEEKIKSGETCGFLKRRYGLSRRSYQLIKENRIEFKEDEVVCPLCGEMYQSFFCNHFKEYHNISYEEFCIKHPEQKLITYKSLIKKSKGGIGNQLSEETKQKLSEINIGNKHSVETKKKISEMVSGDKNPSKRDDVREILVQNHTSKKNPERWAEIMQANSERTKGIPLSEEHKIALAEARAKSSKYGSKIQLYAYRYLKHYFALYHKIEVKSNDYSPFKDHSEKLTVDISIPEHRLAIEWDGIWHRSPIFGGKHLKKINRMDNAKTKILTDHGWKLVRVKDENPDGHKYKQYARGECRKLIRETLLPLIFDPEFRENFKNQYAMSKKYEIANLTL
jgi:hypothetical protein